MAARSTGPDSGTGLVTLMRTALALVDAKRSPKDKPQLRMAAYAVKVISGFQDTSSIDPPEPRPIELEARQARPEDPETTPRTTGPEQWSTALPATATAADSHGLLDLPTFGHPADQLHAALPKG